VPSPLRAAIDELLPVMRRGDLADFFSGSTTVWPPAGGECHLMN
jgi:hypothetical protein